MTIEISEKFYGKGGNKKELAQGLIFSRVI